MGKMLLILIIGISSVISVMTLNINNSAVNFTGISVAEYERINLQNISDSGLEFAISKLTQDTTWGGAKNLSIEGANVNIIVTNTTAKYPGGPSAGLAKGKLIVIETQKGKSKLLNNTIVQMPGTKDVPPPPPFLRYALSTESDIKLNGNVYIRSDNNPLWNANIHTNSSFTMSGNNFIEGFLSYTGNATSSPAGRINTNIVPNYNPENLPNRKKVDHIEMPPFDPSIYSGFVNQTINNNHTISGNVNLGTKQNPTIIRVNGNLTLSGTITGYGVFIVSGNVIVNGNVSIQSGDPTGNNLGIYASGNISSAGAFNIRAQMYSAGNILLSDNTTVYGSVAARGNVQFAGNCNLFYRPATPELTNPFWQPDGKVKTGGGEDDGNFDSNRPKIISTLNY